MTQPDFKEWAALLMFKSPKQIVEDLEDIYMKGVAFGQNDWQRHWEEHAQTSEVDVRAMIKRDTGE